MLYWISTSTCTYDLSTFETRKSAHASAGHLHSRNYITEPNDGFADKCKFYSYVHPTTMLTTYHTIAHISPAENVAVTLCSSRPPTYTRTRCTHIRRIRRNHLQTSRRYLDPNAAPPLFKSRTWTRLLRKHITSCNTIIMRITETAAEINEILFTVSDSLSEFAIGPRLLNGMPPPHP